jgi:hypothetical protein
MKIGILLKDIDYFERYINITSEIYFKINFNQTKIWFRFGSEIFKIDLFYNYYCSVIIKNERNMFYSSDYYNFSPNY